MTGSVADRQEALRQRFAPWTPVTLHGALDAAAEAFGDQPFVITDDHSWSYDAIVAWSWRVANGLRNAGVKTGDKVAIILANYAEFVVLKFAISRIGAIAVPINIMNRRDELRYLLEQSDSAMLVTMDRFRDVDYLDILDQIAPDWATKAGGSTLPALRNIFIFPTGEGEARHGVHLFADLDASSTHPLAVLDVSPQSDCDIIYTSGTTGSPKGVLLTHDMLTRTAFGSAYARAFAPGHRIVFSLPMFHVYGYVEGLLSVLWVGGAIIIQRRFDARDTLDAIVRHRASDALLIPAMTLAIIDAARAQHYDLSSLHFALSSGARAPERIWQEMREVLGVREITTGYGMTEATASTTVTRPDDPTERLLTTNGRMRDVGPAGDAALSNRLVTYEVVDQESGAILPHGAVGELVAYGPGITRGYYKKPEATAAAFTADGWLKTGDLGRIDADGYITLSGRSKESYRCGGEQILPVEVEDLLVSHPTVLQAHIVPIPDERMGEVGVAFIIPRPGATVDTEDLRTFVSERLARYKVPRHFIVASESDIPITASGRARKFLLAEQAIKLLELS